MSGLGSRFSLDGYTVPKPIIEVKGHPMVWWAVQSLPEVNLQDIIFIVNEQHVHEHKIDLVLKSVFGTEIVIIIEKQAPRGQATTVLLAEKEIELDSDLIIYNCDTFAPTIAKDLLEAISKDPDCDGFIPVFNSSAPNLSYVKCNELEIVSEVAEKRVISNFGTIGLYHFKYGRDFIWAVNEMIENKIMTNNEFYILPAYQFLIDKGKKIKKIDVDQIHVLGTPKELNEFLNNTSY